MNRPAHAKNFPGHAKNIPARDVFMLPYQERWVKDISLMKLMEKSRRVGISYASAYEDVRYHAQKLAALDTWVSSRDEPSALLNINDCRFFARLLNVAAEDLGYHVLDDKGNCGHELRFAGGTVIHSVASNADVFAGKGGRVKLDEYALRRDPRGVYGIAGPTIDWGGTLAIISTHRGDQNYFNVLIDEIRNKGNPKGFSIHRVTLQDALDQGFLWKLQTKLPKNDPRLQFDETDYFNYQRKRAADEETFQQEYMCNPASDAGAFLPYDLIDSVTLRDGNDLINHAPFLFSLPKGARCLVSPDWLKPGWSARTCENYGGFDVARVGDLSVIWIWEIVAGIKITRLVIIMKNVPFAEQEAVLDETMNRLGVRRMCIDASGLGRQLAERAQKRHGEYRIEAITFTLPIKEMLAYPFRSACEDKSVRLPGDPLIISDLRKVRKETTAANNVRFVAERSADGEGHADCFWAGALGLHAAKSFGGPFMFRSLSAMHFSRARDDDDDSSTRARIGAGARSVLF